MCEIFPYQRREFPLTILHQPFPVVFADIGRVHALPVPWPSITQLATQPIQIPSPILSLRPELLGGSCKQPLFPVVLGPIISEHSQRRVAKLDQQARAMMLNDLSPSHLIPIFCTPVAQLLTEPIQIPMPITSRLPEPIRNSVKAPLLPLVCGVIVLKNRQCE